MCHLPDPFLPSTQMLGTRLTKYEGSTSNPTKYCIVPYIFRPISTKVGLFESADQQVSEDHNLANQGPGG